MQVRYSRPSEWAGQRNLPDLLNARTQPPMGSCAKMQKILVNWEMGVGTGMACNAFRCAECPPRSAGAPRSRIPHPGPQLTERLHDVFRGELRLSPSNEG